MGHVEKALFAKSNSPTVFENAQSGGCLTETLLYLLESKRIDAALVVHQVNHEAKYRVVTNTEDLLSCQSSQYTPVSLSESLRDIAEYGRVAVVGLPCHIEGIHKLKKAFPEKYPNITYLLGLVCAGTLAQSCVEITKRIGEPKIGAISEDDIIYWRLKKYSSYKRADIAIVDPTGTARILDNNIRHLCKRYLTSPRCKLCFDKMNLYADIAFGDCWGIKGADTKDGGNIIICRTKTGDEVISDMVVQRRIVSRPCSTDEISQGQEIPKKRRTVEKALAIYKQKAYEVPGWNGKFTMGDSIDEKLGKGISDFIARDKAPVASTLKDIASKVKAMLIYKRITGKIRKAIGLQ